MLYLVIKSLYDNRTFRTFINRDSVIENYIGKLDASLLHLAKNV